MKNTLILTFLLFTNSLMAIPSIIIDPGHGGVDHGTTYGSILESKISLQISFYLEQLLQKNKNYNVALTRKTNTNVSLLKRFGTGKNVAATFVFKFSKLDKCIMKRKFKQ